MSHEPTGGGDRCKPAIQTQCRGPVLLASLLLALLGAGCREGFPCRSQTLYLYLHFAQTAMDPWSESVAQADRLQVRVQAATRTIEGSFNRSPDESELVVEVNFVDGYPQGEMAEVSVTAYTGQQALATEVLPPFQLEPGCTGAQVTLGDCQGGTLCPMTLGGLGCVDTRSDIENCGACGNTCDARHAPPICNEGQCTSGPCNPGFLDCDNDRANGCEARPSADPNNCGGCGIVCGGLTPLCDRGTCSSRCPSGWGACRGACYDLRTDGENCGACGQVCPASETCQQGQCQ
jgi:hypothetical protein